MKKNNENNHIYLSLVWEGENRMRTTNLVLAVVLVLFLITGFIPIQTTPGQEISMIMLSNIELVTVTDDFAAVTWVTNLPAETTIQWGQTDELGDEVTILESTQYHMGKITGLNKGTIYYYRVGSGGRFSEISNFTTLRPPDMRYKSTFAIVTDTHFDVDGKNTPNGFMYGESTRLLQSLVDELNQDSSLDFVMTAGDLTNVGTEEDYAGFVDTMKELNVPWYPVLGNHDKNSLDWYQYYLTYVGKKETYYSFDQGKYHFIVLDSAVQGQVKGDLNETQLTWLQNDLDANFGKPTLIFMHHINHRIDTMGIEEDAKDALESILSTHPWVLSVHSGHSHQNELVLSDSSQVYATTAAVVSYPIGYSMVKVYDSGFTQAFYKIGSELETSEESRIRINAASGSINGDEEYLGELSERSFMVEIPKNQPPIINYLTADPGKVIPGGTSVISVVAVDPDGDELDYLYDVQDGWIEGSGFKVTYHAPKIEGTYSVFVKVSDGEFTTDEKSIEIDVQEQGPEPEPEPEPENGTNHAPILRKVWSSKSLVNPDEIVELKVTAYDQDGDKLSYQYESTGGTISGTGAEVTWQAPDKPGIYTISIRVSDGVRFSGKEIITINVKDKAETESGLLTSGFDSNLLLICLVMLVFLFYIKKTSKSNKL